MTLAITEHKDGIISREVSYTNQRDVPQNHPNDKQTLPPQMCFPATLASDTLTNGVRK